MNETRSRNRRLLIILAAISTGMFAIFMASWILRSTPGLTGPSVTYLGGPVCAGCHEGETRLWQGSHHDLAMQPADESTVLGDFDDATFEKFGVISTFFRRDGKFFVRTDGPDGSLQEYEIAYTFGAVPLQQYLIELSPGRLQALSICWDTHSVEEGGQRWYHLYPDEEIRHNDVLHWTAPSQSWNYMCAECHSTDLRKNYDSHRDRYRTTWEEIDVSCEACHGPGSRHVEWARRAEKGEPWPEKETWGLVVDLDDPGEEVSWVWDTKKGIATRSRPRASQAEIETCARCHSRRSTEHEPYVHGRPIGDTHRVALLDEHLYHPDGQILDEVYVYGSFLQSKMYAAGVTCSDCHEPHGLFVFGEADTVCAKCHLPEVFTRPGHHFHDPWGKGASCVACHMPKKIYMGVDDRADHSIRIPSPHLTLKTGAPNACDGCHADKSTEWSAEKVELWYGPRDPAKRHYGETLHAGRRGLPGSEKALLGLLADAEKPGIVRATALTLLPPRLGPKLQAALEKAVEDPDPLVRRAAATSSDAFPPEQRWKIISALLEDPLRTIRLEAARVLASVPPEVIPDGKKGVLDAALEEYRAAQRYNFDRPEAHLKMGVLHVDRGELEEAEKAYRRAIRQDPRFAPAYVNLADLYRLQEADEKGEAVLRDALEVAPEDGDVHHALGLLLVRQKRYPEAVTALGRAAELLPDRARYGYVLAVALRSTGQIDRALAVLEESHERYPGDRGILIELVTVCREGGYREKAIRYARRLVELAPENPRPRMLLDGLEAEGR